MSHSWRVRAPRGHGLSRRFRRQRRPLQRQLFFSFGLAIVVAMGVSAWATAALPGELGSRPLGRVLAYFAGGMVVWGIAGAWAHRLVVPLRELTRVAGELGAGRLASRVRLPHYGTSEVLELGERFNHMAARIEQQVTQQTELLHAVSHELRTPLTRLRVLLGILADSGTHPKLTADLEREVLELDQLVGELLANARIDAGALKARALPIAEALRDGLSRAGLDALRVRAKAVPSTVWADPTLFARALGVLLDNAQKHGGGARGVEVSMRDGLLWFAVQDGGAGVPEADLPRIFEPFARGGGRAPDEAQGLGLGLYLVRRIAEAHGGSVAAHNLPAGGASIGFGLPATPRAA